MLGAVFVPQWLSALHVRDEFTVFIKAKINKGGIIHTRQFAAVALDSGLLVDILPVADKKGKIFVEIPLSVLHKQQLHHLAFRVRNNKLEYFNNGRLQNSVSIPGMLEAIDDDPALTGDWNLRSAPGNVFPDDVRSFLFQRQLSGDIQDCKIFDRYVSDDELAQLSGVPALNYAAPLMPYEKALKAYREFHEASRRKDVEKSMELGKTMRMFMSDDPNRPVFHLPAPLDGIMDPA